MHKFDGAFYVYKHLLCDTKIVINMLKDCKDLQSNKNKIQAEVQENGSEGWCQITIVLKIVIRSHEKSIDENVEREVQQLSEDDDFILMSKSQTKLKKLSDINKLAAAEIKEISEKVEEAGGELSEIQVSNLIKEWTCSLCQVTTQSEITHISHLREDDTKLPAMS
ncbi:hypothetical protein Dsin_032497 [Dipteronia sinensis]|uniref:C2H2-type domain-containing protein n=1 Tax=Dipteronia sinensis TaxID=43782 RepID=A0AAD9ZN32_9ROSI|nr:hypothetical protein Dsin_032497 [Dipteronia sinensis]